MTRIREKDRDILEKAMYLPMLLSILERDRMAFEKGGFKLKEPTYSCLRKKLRKFKDI